MEEPLPTSYLTGLCFTLIAITTTLDKAKYGIPNDVIEPKNIPHPKELEYNLHKLDKL